MKKSILFLFFTLLSLTLYSQYIDGKVLDAETLKPIENVHVYMDNLNNGDITNSRGHYYLNFGREKIDTSNIHFSHVAYKKLSIPYYRKQKGYTVYLTKIVTDLTEIQITERIKLKPSIKYSKLAAMKFGIRGFGATILNNKIYVIGGDASYAADGALEAFEKYQDSGMSLFEILRRSHGSYATTIYEGNLLIYDVLSGTWEIEKDKFQKRAYHNVNVYNNELYVLGGTFFSKKTKNVLLNNTIEILNLDRDTIALDETYPHQALNFASFTYQDNLLVMGGSTKQKRNGLKEYSNKVHLFNLKSGYWYELDSMPAAKETSGVLIKDKIYLIGGFNKKPLTEIETFDLISKKWAIEGHLFYGIEDPAIAASENMIYFFNGGKILTYNLLNKELQEFLIDLSLEKSKMLLADGKLFIVGGVKVNDYSSKASAGLFSIDISEFNKTRINKSKSLK